MKRLIAFGCVLLAFGCKTPKTNINYLSADKRDSSHSRIWQSYDAKIQPGDRLGISVSALNMTSVQPYSLSNSGTPGVATVDNNGNILYPQIGYIKAAGLTRFALRDILMDSLRRFIIDPMVTVDFLDFRITMLGEVAQKGAIAVPGGRINILEAISQSGDVTEYGQRDSILVIREVNGQRVFGTVNLLSNEVFKSPYFVLQQNDMVYVPMIKSKAYVAEKESKFTLSTVTGLLSVATSVILLIINLSRR